MINEMNTIQISTRRNLLGILFLMVLALAGSVAAQSNDPENPTPMTVNEVKGRWSGDKLVSHYYSFTGGPGIVKVHFFAAASRESQTVGGTLSDADGHEFYPAENKDAFNNLVNYIEKTVYPDGSGFVMTFEVKKRQKLVIRFFNLNPVIDSGTYRIRVSGGNASFNETVATSPSGSIKNPAGSNNPNAITCLPKTGVLRLVMNDGTTQEINLSRLREATIKP